MSNHLRELLEILEDECAPVFFEHMSEAACDNVQDQFTRIAGNAMCFYGGNFTDLSANFKVFDELVILPFDQCYIEVTHEDVTRGTFLFGHLLWNDGKFISAQTWRKYQGEWRYLFSWARMSPGKLHVLHCSPNATATIVQGTILQATLFLSALNCVNVKQIEIQQPVKLQAARIKRGKAPLFSYKTLQIDLPHDESNRDISGSSCTFDRRLHLCRGHIKHRKTGYFWWQAHVRGNKKAGIVHKEYSARYPSAMPDGE